MDINKMRWEELEQIGISYKYIKKFLEDLYKIDIVENDIQELIGAFSDKYKDINQDEVLFKLEDTAYRKLAIFSMRDKEVEELKNSVFNQEFINRNRLNNCVDCEKIFEIGKNLTVSYCLFNKRYAVIKMVQKRCLYYDDMDSNNIITTMSKEYYHFTKFIVDLEKNLVFLFYNDINHENEEGSSRNKAITEKKQVFYSLFSKGNTKTISKYNIDDYLYRYVLDYLNSVETNDDKPKVVLVIETEDEDETKNNLRSSKEDGMHNDARLKAIREALTKENHTVKMMECMINNRWIQFRRNGEINLSGPYFGKEVIESVCKEMFTDYTIFKDKEQSSIANN